MKVTRRSLAVALTSTLAAAAGAPQASSQTTDSENPDLESARAQMKSNAELIAKVKLPMSTEPACHFKA